MSKKYRKLRHRGAAPEMNANIASPSMSASQSDDLGRKHVKQDLIQTVAVNLIFIALLIGLYHWNTQSGLPLNNWINNVL